MRRFLLATSLLVAFTPVYAATPPMVTAAPPALATKSLPITVAAGTGVLLRLPSPAATVMSADPGIARVQPASPDSLFLMGVAAGTTTVVATNETGAQAMYWLRPTLTVNAGRQTTTATPVAPVGPRHRRRCRPGCHRPVRPRCLWHHRQGRRYRIGIEWLSGIPTAAGGTRQGAMAIARGYAGEKGTVVNNMLVLGAIQVNVRVRIAEISRTVTRQLGFNWQALGNGNGWKFGLRTGAGVAGVAGVVNPLIPLGLTALNGAAAIPNQVGSGFTSGNGLWDVNSVIDALAADQLVSILAEPNLTAQSGETASFLAGGEFPIPIAGATNNNGTSITVEFKQFGVSLALVPTVLSEGRLNLRIRPEVSQLSQNGAVSVPIGNGVMTIPALTVRRAETTVELGSGQSFAIAGLLQRTSVNGDNALPGIGEIPVIGALFKSNDFQRGESELVIIVTPYYCAAGRVIAGPPCTAPTDGFRVRQTDLDRASCSVGKSRHPLAASVHATATFSGSGGRCRFRSEVRLSNMRIHFALLAVVGLGACSPDYPFDKPGTWSLGAPGTMNANDANLRAMVVNPNDLVAGRGDPGSLGAEAAPPVKRLLAGQRKELPKSNVLDLQVTGDSTPAAAPAPAGE